LLVVYAIEASTMAEQAEIVVQSNAMQDRITVMRGRVEVSASEYIIFNSSVRSEGLTVV